MARTAITPTELTANTVTAMPAGTNIDATNGMYFTATGQLSEYLILVTHTTGSSKTVTVVAGDNPPADAAGQGNLAAAYADGSSTPVQKFHGGPLTSARFIQNDGTVNIDFTASTTGTVAVLHIPRTA